MELRTHSVAFNKRVCGLLAFALCALLARPAWAQESPCAEDPNQVCMDSALFDEVIRQQAVYAELDAAVPKLVLEAFDLVVDSAGHAFYPKTLRGVLSIASKNYDVLVPIDVVLHTQTKKPSHFAMRYKAAGYLDVLEVSTSYRLGGALMVEPVHIGLFGLNTYLGTSSVGGAVSLSLTRNFSAFVGAGLAYADGTLSVPVGVAFSFN